MKKIVLLVVTIAMVTTLCAGEKTVTYGGETLTLKGNFPSVGKKAPVVHVTKTDFTLKKIGGATGNIQVILTVPSIETLVCSAESRRFDKEIEKFKNVEMTVVSMDLPYADDRFCQKEGVRNITISSDFVNREVGEQYGVIIQSGTLKGLLGRATFIIDKKGRVLYQEISPSLTEEPDYKKILGILTQLN